MQSINEWWDTFAESLRASLLGIGNYLPVLLAALLVMLAGWVLASVARVVLIRSGGALGTLIERLGTTSGRGRLRLSERVLPLTANIVFWIVILVSAALASRVAGLDAFSGWLNELVSYLPTLITGILIAVAGYLFSALARDIVTTALGSVGAREKDLAGLVAQTAVLVTAIVVGLDQIGIDVTFLIILVAVLLGGAVISIGLAFGFGARDFVGNVIAARHAQRFLEPGDRARIADIEGRVLEVTATSIVLVNEEGRHVIPASRLDRDVATIRSDEIDEQ
jgi:small-conductance mechanosensitive channel